MKIYASFFLNMLNIIYFTVDLTVDFQDEHFEQGNLCCGIRCLASYARVIVRCIYEYR